MLKLIFPLFLVFSMFCQAQNKDIYIFESSKTGKFRSLFVYQVGSENSDTIIRKKPNGKVILTLSPQDYYTFELTKIKGEWFKVVSILSVEGHFLKIPKKKGWVHYTNIAAGSRKDLEILSTPIDGEILGTIPQENGVGISDVYLNWVKVEFQGLSGWVEREWLCESPVTTCP